MWGSFFPATLSEAVSEKVLVGVWLPCKQAEGSFDPHTANSQRGCSCFKPASRRKGLSTMMQPPPRHKTVSFKPASRRKGLSTVNEFVDRTIASHVSNLPAGGRVFRQDQTVTFDASDQSFKPASRRKGLSTVSLQKSQLVASSPNGTDGIRTRDLLRDRQAC